MCCVARVPGPYEFYSSTTMDKKTLATLIDAYADAKASKNQHLVNSMVIQIQQALDEVFDEGEDETPTESEF